MKKKKPRYLMLVWDAEAQDWVSYFKYLQPVYLMQLRAALRELNKRGYETGRDAPSIYVERQE